MADSDLNLSRIAEMTSTSKGNKGKRLLRPSTAHQTVTTETRAASNYRANSTME